MTIKAKDSLTLQIEDSEATIRAAAQLYFSRQRARWLATHGAALAQRINDEIQQGHSAEIGVETVVKMIEAVEDEANNSH